MSLGSAVFTIGLDKTDAEIVSALDQMIELAHNHERWTYAGVALHFGPQVAEGISSVMNAGGLTTGVIAYATVGFDLSLQQTQDNLDLIAASAPQLAEACAALKAIGRPTAKRYTQFNLDQLPTEEQVASARAKLLFAVWAESVRQTLQAAINGEQTSIAQYKQIIAES